MVKTISHSITEKALQEIMICVNRQGKAYQKYVDGMDESKDNAMYSAEYLQKNVDNLLKELVVIAKANCEAFERHISEIRENEKKNAEVFDITNADFQSALSILNVCGDDINIEMISGIIETLKGQKRALTSIKGMFDKNNINVPTSMNKYFNAEAVVDKFAEALMNLAIDPKNSTHYTSTLRCALSVAEVYGIEIGDDFKELGFDVQRAHSDNLKNAMLG